MGVVVTDESGDECNNCSKCNNRSILINIKKPTIAPGIHKQLNTFVELNECGNKDTSNINSRDLVGNYKEFRIEHNQNDLRIIGNNNRIRITHNSGNLQIIGNSTRLKISANNGRIRYTGNDGRISLGAQSKQQYVDYIGCNGILKVKNSNVNENATAQHDDKRSCNKTRKPKVKSASYGGNCKNAQWQQFNELFHSDNSWRANVQISLPNLKETYHDVKNLNDENQCNGCKHKYDKLHKHAANVNVVNNFGNIIVKDSVNINIG